MSRKRTRLVSVCSVAISSSNRDIASAPTFARSWAIVWRGKSSYRHGHNKKDRVASSKLDQAALAQFALHEGIDDRRHDDAAHAERSFAQDDGQEDLPGLGVDLAAHDAGVEQVLQLVDDDQKDQRR